ncbi:Cof-type HAD-IIB family hydrolase [Furfurilactobacillus sp. WILCCON 0119]|uniref:Cof-type HAD-IIB family hydrolase n=1 Tax=Furfurilactobacillus entadae TaxID=2922307 RepID=UPI0035ED33B1
METKAVVFFDLDGTLFDDDKRVLPESIAAIKEMQENDILPVIATGRNIFEIQDVLDQTGIDSVVSANGSYVQYQGQKLFQETIDPALIAEFTAFAQKQGDVVAYYNNEGFAVTGSTPDVVRNYQALRLAVTVDPDYYKTRAINFMNVFNHDKEDLYNAQFAGQLALVRNNRVCLDTMNSGITKRSGLERLLKEAGLVGVPTYAFGDQLNDLEMFAGVDTAIVMGNGHPRDKAVADYITTTNTTDGIVNGLRHYHLIAAPEVANQATTGASLKMAEGE